MNTEFNIMDIIASGKIANELDFERALIADRKLRILTKKNPEFKPVRKKLRDLIQDYESKNWFDQSKVTGQKLKESDVAEAVAEKERLFIESRKNLIKLKLKDLGLHQQDLGLILGHNSKSYMSELINGISPFTLRDLIVINKVLKIDLTDLIPTFLSHAEQLKIKSSIKQLGHSKLNSEDLALV